MKENFMVRSLIFLITISLIVIGISGCVRKSPAPRPANKSRAVPATAVDVLFIAYDYGESLAFKSALARLKSKTVNVRILTFGAADRAFRDVPEATQLISLLTTQQKLQHESLLNSLETQRTTTLPVELLEYVVSKWQPQVVVTGMASTAQAQLTNKFALKNAYTVAFYDNFDNPVIQSFVQPWLASTLGVNEIFIPGDYLIKDFLKIKALSSSEITVTGQPALDQWIQSAKYFNKEQIFEKLNIAKNSRVVTFAAGYDQSSLNWADKFIEAATERPDLVFFIALHPKMDNRSDAPLVKKVAGLKNVKIAPPSVTTEELVSVSALLATHKSTVGIKAAYLGVPVLYVAEDNYDNVLISHDLAKRASSWSEIVNAIHYLLDYPDKKQLSFKKLGIPLDSVPHFDDRLLTLLGHTTKKANMPLLESIQTG